MADKAYLYDTPINREAADYWRTPESKQMYENPLHTYSKDSFYWREDNQTYRPRRVFSAHLLPNGIGHENLLYGKIKIIFIYRNPKDSCVSNYNLYRDCPRLCTDPGKFADFAINFSTDFEHLHSGCWVKTMRAWEEFTDRHPDVPFLPVRYEQIVKNVAKEVKRIADFCEISASENLLQEITERASIQNMKQMNDVSYYKKYFHKSEPTYIRKGKIGDWKNWFTVDLNERFDGEINKRTGGMKYEIIYE